MEVSLHNEKDIFANKARRSNWVMWVHFEKEQGRPNRHVHTAAGIDTTLQSV